MRKLILFFIFGYAFFACESYEVKENRKTYKNFLYEMSDRKEYLKINSEKVSFEKNTVTYFLVDFESRYCGQQLNDVVEFYFVGNKLNEINRKFYQTYKTEFLMDLVFNRRISKENRLKAIKILKEHYKDSDVYKSLLEIEQKIYML